MRISNWMVTGFLLIGLTAAAQQAAAQSSSKKQRRRSRPRRQRLNPPILLRPSPAARLKPWNK